MTILDFSGGSFACYYSHHLSCAEFQAVAILVIYVFDVFVADAVRLPGL